MIPIADRNPTVTIVLIVACAAIYFFVQPSPLSTTGEDVRFNIQHALVPLVGFIPLPLPAWVMLAIWFVLQFFTGPDSAVAWVAHVAGFVFGVVVALAPRHRTGDARSAYAIGG